MNRKVWFVFLMVCLSFLAALVLAEFFTKKIDKYQSQHLLDYGNTMRPEGLGTGGYLKENLTLYVTDGLGGTVRWTNNAAGFRHDQDFAPEPPPGVLRVLSLGDSFVAGYRVGQEETFSFLLEQWLNQHLGRSEVLVPEIEEPTTALYYLKNFGLKFHPQIVLLGITLGNDIVQSYLAKGGYVLHIDHEGVTIAKQPSSSGGPRMEDYNIPSIYLRRPSYLEDKIAATKRWLHHYHLYRRLYQDNPGISSWFIDAEQPKLFDVVNGLGVFLQPPPPMIEEAYQRLCKIITAFQIECQQQGIMFAVQLFPQRFQVQPPDWERAVERYRLNAAGFDLMEPNRKIGAFCREHHVRLIDPTEAMAERYATTGKNLYLPLGDMHWNREGHRAFFACSLPALSELMEAGFQKVQAKTPKALLPNQDGRSAPLAGPPAR